MTMPNAIRKLAKTFLNKPLNIQIEAVAREKATIKQKAWKVQGMTKNDRSDSFIRSDSVSALLH